jgi:hypothetical protein
MASLQDSQYYISRKQRLLRDFDGSVKRVRGLFVSRYGEAQTNALIGETRREYEALIPQLPYIGGKQPFTQFIISTAWFLAMYRVLKARGESLETIGQLIFEIDQAFLQAYPRFMRRFFGHMTFTRRYIQKLRKRAAESHQRRYPGDYVYTFVEGDGETFDHGVDYLECATCKFLQQQGAPELGPYLCIADALYSEMMNWGLIRTKTLAEGADKCDFRFKKGGPTQVTLPQSLRLVREKKQ